MGTAKLKSEAGPLDAYLRSDLKPMAQNLRTPTYSPWEEWHQLWIASGVKDDAWRIFDALAKLYNQPWRRYHTLAYVVRCLRELTRPGVRGLAKDPLAVEYAIWFYNVACCHRQESGRNRLNNSIDTFWALGKALPNERVLKICDLIKIAVIPEALGIMDPDAKLLLDIELADLGRPPAVFSRYEQALREEAGPSVRFWLRYPPEGPEGYNSERREELVALLNRRDIYHTEFFRNLYEKQARENLKRAIADPTLAAK